MTVSKPKAKVVGGDGNVFAVLGTCSQALKKAGQGDKATEMRNRVFEAESYSKALSIMSEYVELC